MNDLEPKLGTDYIQSFLYYDSPIHYDKPITLTEFQSMLYAIRPFDIQQESDKTINITDNILENYFE